MEAQIAANTAKYNAAHRRTFVNSKSEARFTEYVKQWSAKVEAVGNANYPEEARGRLYGSVRVVVTLKADGSLDSAVVDRPSGQAVLDQAALRIVRLASPFAPFTPEIRKDTDFLVITRTWYFSRGDRIGDKPPSNQ